MFIIIMQSQVKIIQFCIMVDQYVAEKEKNKLEIPF